ncbi:uncharacterized protein LOC108226808 isoform X2 [Daucus carota subsp. sativus]|uniref:uncharacterized protein LOC108226808 isoform X2 n=1 Tax=Daucus carota subsp. sativus TaxID=79200 RepID=UPI0030834D68
MVQIYIVWMNAYKMFECLRLLIRVKTMILISFSLPVDRLESNYFSTYVLCNEQVMCRRQVLALDMKHGPNPLVKVMHSSSQYRHKGLRLLRY